MIEQKFSVKQDDFTNGGKVSSQIKRLLKQFGIDAEKLRKMSVACYESEINMIIHSYGGEVILTIDEDKVVFVFRDSGPGIPDVEKALLPGWSTASDRAREMGFGAGMGLVNIKRVSDTFDLITSSQGTTVTIGFYIS